MEGRGSSLHGALDGFMWFCPPEGGHFSSVFLVPFLGAEKVPKGSPKGVVLGHFFALLGYLLGYLVFASIFGSF